MTYPETTQYLESFINYELIPAYPYKESLKLERISDFLDSINNPQRALRCIHIAGTKGKGSTSAFIAYILREGGFSVGLYTSPHLSDFRERIRILRPRSTLRQQVLSLSGTRCPLPAGRQGLGLHPVPEDFEGMISKRELAGLVNKLRPQIDQYNKRSGYGPLTFFEVYTAIAFACFKEKRVDFTVLETGLGGRLDATNMVDSLVSVITPISYEHTQKLGNTLTKIAREKAGIIKNSRCIAISAPQKKEAMQVITDRCREVGAKLYAVGKDIVYKETGKGLKLKGIFNKYPSLKINLIGEHQLVNAATAVGAIEALSCHKIKVGIESVRKGLKHARWPGRCEIIAKKPLVILDGAQNIASICALKGAIARNFKYKKLILIFGISCDKDIKGASSQLHDFANSIILTKADNPRATEPVELARYFTGKQVVITKNVEEAKREAYKKALKEDLILVTGSLFVVGEYRNLAKTAG